MYNVVTRKRLIKKISPIYVAALNYFSLIMLSPKLDNMDVITHC